MSMRNRWMINMTGMQYCEKAGMLMLVFALLAAGCGKSEAMSPAPDDNGTGTNISTEEKMKISVGSQVFTVTLNKNTTTAALRAMLPFSLNMSELNGNEKFFYFSTTLPTNAGRGGNIQAGDLMLYGNNCLVLFYESLNTSTSYTRLGRVDNVSGLAAALGTGSVTVAFTSE